MKRVTLRILTFIAVSLVWWVAVYAIMMLDAIGHCGMGPDAP